MRWFDPIRPSQSSDTSSRFLWRVVWSDDISEPLVFVSSNDRWRKENNVFALSQIDESHIMSHGGQIKKSILQAGLALWPNVTARAIGRRLNMTHSNVLYHFDTADNLVNAVASYAVEIGESRVIVQLLASKHAAINDMKAADRAKYMATV